MNIEQCGALHAHIYMFIDVLQVSAGRCWKIPGRATYVLES